MALPTVEKATIYSALKFQQLKTEVRKRGLMTRGTKRSQAIGQLEADDLKSFSESAVRNLNMELVEPELSFEALEKKRCVSSGLPWPHIHYDYVSDMPKGTNYIRLSSGWRCLSSIRVIELRLSRDFCLNNVSIAREFQLLLVWPLSRIRRPSLLLSQIWIA